AAGFFGVYSGKLANDGERLALLDSDGRTVTAVRYNDKNGWPEAADGAGCSLVPVDENGPQDDAANWRASNLIGGSPGYDDGAPFRVVISEALTHTDPPAVDAIELLNAGDAAADIGGWYLSDTLTDYRKYRIPDGTTVAAGGYMVFDEHDFNTDTNDPACFALDSHGDQIYLTRWDAHGNLQYLAEESFGGAANGRAFGRHVCSDGHADFVAQTTADTLGAANAAPLVGPVVINEMMYHPAAGGLEFVELVNIGGGAVNLYDPAHPANTWRLGAAVDYAFPAGTTLAAGEYVLVASTNEAAFRAAYPGVPAGVRVFGPYAGRLGNGGESLKLWRPDAPDPEGVPWILVDRVKYNDNSPWPENADGAGHSLERQDPHAYGNDPANWASSRAAGGTPGEPNGGVLVPATAGWRYHDRGEDLGAGWRAASYDDGAWRDGNAPLGFAYPDVDTEVSYGEDPNNKPITTYFRKRFTLGASPSSVTQLTLKARYDDGFVAWLNGQEIARRSMPGGTVSYGTVATSHDAADYETIDLLAQKDRLVTGSNVLAVEVHQSGPGSSDLFMDMELTHAAAASNPRIQTSVASITVPEGGTAGFQVRLSAQPASSVTVTTARSAGDSDVTVSGGGTLTFTTSNWNTYQTVTLAAAEDNADNANGTATFTCSGSGLTSASVTATEADDDYTLSISAANGTVAKNPNSPYYDNGTSVQLTATPNAGYAFTGWSGDLSGTANPASLTMNANKSVTASFTAAPPAAPDNVAAAAVSSSEIRLTWRDNSDNETQFKIRRSADGVDFGALDAVFVGPNVTSWTDTGLAAGARRWYIVRAENAAGVSAYSAAVDATTPAALETFTAYNDLAWFAGQPASNITTFTTTNSFPAGVPAGRLLDYATGQPLAARLAVAGGNGVMAEQGAHPAAGTDAHAVFDGKLDAAGTISYWTDDLVLTLSELDPALRYELVLYADRGKANYAGADARWQRATLAGAAGFANASTPGASVTTETTANDTTVYNAGYNTANGYVTRFRNIDPGADGTVVLRVKSDAANACYPYANALMLKGTKADDPESKVESGAVWKYRKGTAEASAPATAWRNFGFDDSAWAEGAAPFGYGSDAYGTTLADMRNTYSCLYLRKTFEIASAARVRELRLWVRYDDGFAMWVNGQEVARVKAPGEPGSALPYTTLADYATTPEEWSLTLTGADMPALVDGTNVVAVQVLNNSLGSGDLSFDGSLSVIRYSLSVAADADQDGMPDDWATEHLAALPDPADRVDSSDPDHDGLSNLEEYIAGTDPTGPASTFDVSLQAAGGGLLVSFLTVAAGGTGYEGLSRYYALEECPAGPGVWAALPDFDRIAGLGQPVVYTNAAPDGSHSYRARVWLE
ncbi:MAG: lamin tail domain-containing protein, partial [Kiritimatiellae bacterium]|nr:lamin tail domain-containing protein [Kiritimatiellia bacterium]